MSIAKKAIISTLWTSGMNYFALGIGFIVGLYRDRLLMPEENGIYMYGVAVVDFLFILAAVSFNISLIQSKEDRPDLYATGLTLTIGLALLLAVATGAVAWILALRHTLTIKIEAFLVLAGFSTLNLFTILFTSFLEKKLEYKKIARVNFLSVLAFPVVSYALVRAGWGAWGMVFGYCSSFVVSFLGMLVVSRYPLRLALNPATARWYLTAGWKLVFSRGLEVLFVRYGTLVTESVLGTSLQGSYGRALKYWELAPQTVAPAVVTVALPTYAKLQDNPEKLSNAFEYVLFFLVRALCPFVLLFGILPEVFIAIIGPQWTSAVPVLRILAIGALLSPMFENIKQLLYAQGRQGAVLKTRAIQLAFFVPGMYLLVRHAGISGAATALMANYAVGIVCIFFFLRNSVNIPWRKSFAIPIAATAITAAAYLAIRPPAVFVDPLPEFCLRFAYVAGLFTLLDVLFEWRALREHWRYVRSVFIHA